MITATACRTQTADPHQEDQRLAALRDYGILDTAPDERFDRLTALAAEMFDMPIALVSLVDSERQWFKSHHGLPLQQTPRETAFCAHAIVDDAPLIIEDTAAYLPFRNYPLVRDAGIRFYAGFPLRDGAGHRVGALCLMDRKPRSLPTAAIAQLTTLAAIAVDEMELHKARLHTERLAQEKAAANKLKSHFLRSMNHEFRTPLNAILGFSQILEMNPAKRLREEELEYVEAIKSAGHTLLRLTDGMLSMAQLEAGAIPFDLEPLLARDAIAQAFNTHAPLAQLNGVAFTQEIPDSNLQFIADENQLQRILSNFLSNAFKFTPRHGQITLGCSSDEDGHVCLYVQDSGCGIPAERQREAFQSFNRLGREGSAVAGTGLGLAIARRLTHAMDGEIGFDSEENIGSLFWVRFPTVA